MTPLAASPASAHSFYGLVTTTGEAHALLEGARRGLIPKVARRLSEAERKASIIPGAVFIFSESSGIKRWTDQYRWSPSRVQGSFLCYTQTSEPGVRSTLIKQSFSSTDAAGKLHLIAYYTNESLRSNIPRVSTDPRVSHLVKVKESQNKNTERRRSSLQSNTPRPSTSTLSRSPPFARPPHAVASSYPNYSPQIQLSPPMSSIASFKRHSLQYPRLINLWTDVERLNTDLSPTSPASSAFDSRTSISSSSSTAPFWPASKPSPPGSAFISLPQPRRQSAPNSIHLPPLVPTPSSPIPFAPETHRRESWDQQQLDMFLPGRAS